MGFFSSVSRVLGGGSESSSQNSSQSGFALLPKEIQDVYKNYASDLGGMFKGGAANELFNPLGQTEYETNALDQVSRGVTATPESLRADIDMQMNPFDDYVIDEINRQAGGEYSILKQAANEAGQMGSNRQMLGANDIDLSRLNQIGSFKQGQYNKAVDNSLNQLTDARTADVGLGFTAGEFLRNLDAQGKQAPINAMTSFGQLLGVLPTSGGSTAQGTSKSSSDNGIGGTIAGIAGAFSDRRLKENIEQVGEENGFPIYEFNYINDPDTRWVGVMAQDVEKTHPEAVFESEGMKRVRYDMIGVEMRKAV